VSPYDQGSQFVSLAFGQEGPRRRHRPIDGQQGRLLRKRRCRELLFAMLKKELIDRRSGRQHAVEARLLDTAAIGRLAPPNF
jgi:hypothetical protein